MSSIHLLEPGLHWPPETFVRWKLEALARRGYQITVATPTRLRGDLAAGPGIRVLRVPHWSEPRWRRVVGVVGAACRMAFSRPAVLRKLLAAACARAGSGDRRTRWAMTLVMLRTWLPLAGLRPDIVHFEWESVAIDYLPLVEIWRSRMVVSGHGAILMYPYLPGGERLLAGVRDVYERADAAHCVCQTLTEEAQRRGMRPAQARLIPSAVDPDYFSPLASPQPTDNVLRVLSIGWLRWLKGHEYALMAIERLRRSGQPVTLTILGGDPASDLQEASDRGRVLGTIADLGLEGVVELRGHVGTPEVRARLRRSDTLLHASLMEGLPTVLLEAMACALPVVAADCGGIREALTDGQEGFLVSPRRPDHAAQALLRLAQDPALRRRMGASGRLRIERDFRLRDQIDRYDALYRELAAGTPPRPAPGRVVTAA